MQPSLLSSFHLELLQRVADPIVSRNDAQVQKLGDDTAFSVTSNRIVGFPYELSRCNGRDARVLPQAEFRSEIACAFVIAVLCVHGRVLSAEHVS